MQNNSVLSDVQGKPLISTALKTGFLGLIIAAKSFQNIFRSYVETGKLNYILTFKFSQDHLETIFSLVRGGSGYNNNPTAVQFLSTFKKLVLGACSKVYSWSNAIEQDDTVVLNIFSNNQDCQEYVESSLELQDEFETLEDIEPVAVGEYRTHCCDYIGGFAARKISKLCTCSKSNLLVVKNTDHQLINFKDRFGSNSVSVVCKITETELGRKLSMGYLNTGTCCCF